MRAVTTTTANTTTTAIPTTAPSMLELDADKYTINSQ
jgi:hypothetical protein